MGNNIFNISSGTGMFTVAANITSIGKWAIGDGCKIVINAGQRFG